MKASDVAGPKLIETATVQPSDRLDFWRGVVWEIHCPAQFESLTKTPYTGRIETFAWNSIYFSRFDAAAASVHRTRRHLGQSDRGDVAVLIPVEGSFLLDHLGHEIVCKPGELVFVDIASEFKFVQAGNLKSFSLRVPQSYLLDRVSDLRGICGRSLPVLTGLPRCAMDTLESIFRHGHDIADIDGERAVLRAIELLAVHMDRREAPTSAVSVSKQAILQRAQRYIARHFLNDIAPAEVARGCGISTSYLYELFREAGLTPSEYLKNYRLSKARKMLSDPDMARISITEIMYRSGFKDPSTFSRTFKFRFGKSPSTLRHEAIGSVQNRMLEGAELQRTRWNRGGFIGAASS